MKPEPLSKLEKKNTLKSMKFDDDFMLANYDLIVIFPIYG